MTRRRISRSVVTVVALLLAAVFAFALLQSTNRARASSGVRFDAIGDSITWGKPILFRLAQSGEILLAEQSAQGWPEVLGELIRGQDDAAEPVRNQGIPGAEVIDLLMENRRQWLGGWTQAPDALVLVGTNNSNPYIATPSGLGCKSGACEDSYLDFMRHLVRNLKSSGRETIYIGLVPPSWGNSRKDVFALPLSPEAKRNVLIREYNRVITDELAGIPGVRLGPDLFSCFLTDEYNRYSLFADVLHPNTLGQVFIAALWRDSIENGGSRQPDGKCPKPVYFLEALDTYRYGHRQNLLAVGDSYYVDEEYSLLEVPAEFETGIWVMQPNGERDNASEDYLSFDVGDKPVDVYIAYDAAGSAPLSTTHEFELTSLSSPLAVSDPGISEFAFARASNVIGQVRLGGNLSAGGEDGRSNYLVVVVP